MAPEKIVSADSHVVEAADVWTSRIEPRFSARRFTLSGITASCRATFSSARIRRVVRAG